MKYLSKSRLISASSAFPGAILSSNVHGELWTNLSRLLLIMAAVVSAFVLATGISQAHDEAYCDDQGEDTHYIEDVVANPPGHFMMYASSTHDHLIVKAGDGVSGVSTADVSKKQDGTTHFDYQGTDVDLPVGVNAFTITFTTSKADAVVKICFEDNLGMWFPIPVDSNNNPIANSVNNSPPETQNLPIPRLDVEIDGGATHYDVGNYFTDPDNDTLTYTAVPTDSTKVTVTVLGSRLTLTPVATGVTDVTVTASDSSDTVDASFTVVVYKQPTLRTDTEKSGIVDPNAETSVTAGSLSVIFPSGSMTNKYYQARIDPESDDCGDQAPSGNEYLCLSVDLFDLAAQSISENLDSDAKMVLTLDQTQTTAVQTAIDDDTFSLYKGDGTANSWSEITPCPDPVGTSECYTFTTTSSGSKIEVINISGFSDFTATIPAPEPPQQPTSSPTPTTRRSSSSGGGGGGSPAKSNQRPSLDVDDISLTYRENDTSPVATFNADDPDDDDLSWEIGGPDRKSFDISDGGVLSFKTSPDFENPADRNGDNEYQITITVEDDGSPSQDDSEDVTILVTNQNELSDISGDAELSVQEGQTGLLAQYRVEDPEDDEITWSLTGADAANFQIDHAGNLSLQNALDFEVSSVAGSNVHSVTVTAADDGRPQMSSQLSVAVTVSNVNEAPESSNLPGIELTVGDDTETLNLADYFTDPDGDDLAFAVSGAPDSDVATATVDGASLSISAVGAGSASFEVSGTDGGGLSATATANVTVVAPEPVRNIDPTSDYDAIVRPIATGFSDLVYQFVHVTVEVPDTTPDLQQEVSHAADIPRGPIPSISPRLLPPPVPAPTVAAPKPIIPTPTARPVPIRASESRPTPAPEATQAASRAPSTPTAQQPTEAPVVKAPIAPVQTATPATESAPTPESDDSRSWLPLWLIALLIMLGLLMLASMPLWVVNLLIIGGLVALTLALASVALWLAILVAVAALIILAGIGLLYGIATRGW